MKEKSGVASLFAFFFTFSFEIPCSIFDIHLLILIIYV
jgi:hypothetical protein